MSMFFVQHGMALDKFIDADRPLSEQGEQNVKNIASHVPVFSSDVKPSLTILGHYVF